MPPRPAPAQAPRQARKLTDSNTPGRPAERPLPQAGSPAMLVPADTRTRLLQAAMGEFIEAGFAGTDTNRIARRAGFSPQTFYRWFADKTAAFIEVLLVWEELETALLCSILEAREVDAASMADACVESFKPFLTFRRNLRAVIASHPEIRAVRAAGRGRLLDALAQINARLNREELGSVVIQIEQLCEALAQGEMEDMGLTGAKARDDLAQLINRLRA